MTKTHSARRYLSTVFVLLLSLPSVGKAAREIGWEDLIGLVEPYEDPVLELRSDQKLDLFTIAEIRKRLIANGRLSEDSVEKLRAKEKSLQDQGIDVDGLLAQREIFEAKREAAAEAVNGSLDGQRIRMPGYVLPLDFDGKLVREALLVPFFGACIHVPPPPPNQIVHVKLKDGYEQRGLFAPVWVEGRMRVGKSEQELFLGDGAAQIPVGYSLTAERIEPYQVSK